MLCMWLLSVVAADGQTTIRSVTGVIDGHSVGGVTVDLVGDMYVADFGNLVWRISLEGDRKEFVRGLYGASGNAVDSQGNLWQSSYYGDSITKIGRNGEAKAFATSGLSGPVGIAIGKDTNAAYVANCRGNFIAKVEMDGKVSPFARSDLFKCPNGIAFDHQRNLFVVNYRDNKMVKIDPTGNVVPFTAVSDKGLGHLCFKEDRFYVTASQSHAIYEVMLDGKTRRILGNGERGIVDGDGSTARLSFPNGIACHPWAPRLYINELASESASSLPPRAIIREVVLPSST